MATAVEPRDPMMATMGVFGDGCGERGGCGGVAVAFHAEARPYVRLGPPPVAVAARLLSGAVVSFFVVGCWRALWYLQDVWFFPGDKVTSGLVSMFLPGLGLHAFVLVPTRGACAAACPALADSRPGGGVPSALLRRCWLLGAMVATVGYWRGAWVLYDAWAGPGGAADAGRLGLELLVCTAVLLALGSLAAMMFPPMVYLDDAALPTPLAHIPWVAECFAGRAAEAEAAAAAVTREQVTACPKSVHA